MNAQTVAVDKARDANSKVTGRPRSSGGILRLVHRGVALLVFIGLWQIACQAKLNLLINFGNVPGPIAVAGAFIGFVQSPEAGRHIGSSLIRKCEQNTGWKPMLHWPSGLSSDLPKSILVAIAVHLE